VTSDYPYDGGTLFGFNHDLVAAVRLDHLAAGYSYDSLSLRAQQIHAFSRNDTVLLLEEWMDNEFKIIHWINF
jgi:hypothetical protein